MIDCIQTFKGYLLDNLQVYIPKTELYGESRLRSVDFCSVKTNYVSCREILFSVVNCKENSSK